MSPDAPLKREKMTARQLTKQAGNTNRNQMWWRTLYSGNPCSLLKEEHPLPKWSTDAI